MNKRFIATTLIATMVLAMTGCKTKEDIMPVNVPSSTENVQVRENTTKQPLEAQEETVAEPQEQTEQQTGSNYALVANEDDVNPHSGYYRDRITWSSSFINDDINLYQDSTKNWKVESNRYGWDIKDGEEIIAGYKEIIVHHRKDFGEEVVFEDYMDNKTKNMNVTSDFCETDPFAQTLINEYTVHAIGVQRTDKYFFSTDVYKNDTKTVMVITVYDNDSTEMLEEYGGEAVSFAARIYMTLEDQNGISASDNLYEYATTLLADSLGYEPVTRSEVTNAVNQ